MEADKVTCVVWFGQEFDDKIVKVLERIGERLGPDNDLRELRLIGSGVTEEGKRTLATLIPNATITSHSEEEAERNPRLTYADPARAKEMFPDQ